MPSDGIEECQIMAIPNAKCQMPNEEGVMLTIAVFVVFNSAFGTWHSAFPSDCAKIT